MLLPEICTRSSENKPPKKMTETLEPKKQDYSQIHQENKGSFQVGRIRMHEGQLAFKNASTHDVDQYSIETDIEKATWFRASKGYTLRLFLKNGDIKTYLGFSKTDFNNIRAHFPELNHISHSSRGWNFGEIDIDQTRLLNWNRRNAPQGFFDIQKSFHYRVLFVRRATIGVVYTSSYETNSPKNISLRNT